MVAWVQEGGGPGASQQHGGGLGQQCGEDSAVGQVGDRQVVAPTSLAAADPTASGL